MRGEKEDIYIYIYIYERETDRQTDRREEREGYHVTNSITLRYADYGERIAPDLKAKTIDLICKAMESK